MDIGSLMGGQLLGNAAQQQGLRQAQPSQQGQAGGMDQLMGVVPYLGPLMQAKTSLLKQFMPPGPAKALTGVTGAAMNAGLMAALQRKNQGALGGAGAASPGLPDIQVRDLYPPEIERPETPQAQGDPVQEALARRLGRPRAQWEQP